MSTSIVFFTLAAIAVLVFGYFVPLNLWITAIFSGVKLELMELVFMRVRKSPVNEIVNGLIVSSKLGLGLKRVELETHALAGGDVTAVVKTLGLAKQKGITTSLKEVCTWDLSNENLEEKLLEKANSTGNDQLKIAILNKVKVLSETQLKEVKTFLDQLA